MSEELHYIDEEDIFVFQLENYFIQKIFSIVSKSEVFLM